MKKEKLDADFFRDRKVLKILSGGSERESVVLVGSILDEMLRRLLEKSLLNTAGGVLADAFESSNGPFSSFSNKITVCYLTGLISKKMYDDLNLIRKIRNTFAHNIFQCSFEMDEIKNQVSRLYFITHSLFEEWIETASIKDKFVLDSVIIIVALVKKIVRKDSFGECIDEIDDLGFEEIDWEYLNSEIEK